MLIVPSMSNIATQGLTNSTRLLKNAVETGATVAVRNHLKAIAEKNREIVRYHLALAEKGDLSRQEAVDRARSILLSQQIGSSGYIYCIDSQGTAVVHPNQAVENTDNTRFPFVREQMRRKEGYIEYEWQNPGEDSARPKALYMVYLPSLDWILSVSSYKAEFNELVDIADFRDMVLSLRFGKSGYAYVINQQGDTLIHPILRDYNALKQSDLSANFVRTMIAEGSGNIEYEWRNPDEQTTRTKLAVFESIPAYEWIIVSSSYLDEINQPARVAQKIAYFSALLLLVAAALTGYFLSGWLTRPVAAMITRLDDNAKNMEHYPLPQITNDELGRLAGEFNSFLETIERKNRELSQEKERYRSLFETSPDAVFLLKGISLIDCNNSTLDIFAGDKATLLNSSVVELSPGRQPNGRDSSVMAKEITARAKVDELQTFEWLHRRVDGELFNAEVRLKTFGVEKGDPLLVAFVRDITDRKTAEDALRQSEKKYRELIENAGDAIFIAQEERIVFCNSKTVSLTGYSKEELNAASFDALIHESDRELILERHRKRLKGEGNLPSNYSFTLLTKSSAERTVQLSTVLIDWNGKPATLNFVRDITEQRKLESAFQQAQKMQAIGTLAGGIAHDFNNILMGVQGRIELSLVDEQTSPATIKHLQIMAEHIKSAADLTRQLLGMARGGKYQPKPTDLNELVNHSIDMFGRTKKEIEVITDMTTDRVVSEVDRRQLEQVLLNMFVNAWQAMAEGGKLYLATSVIQLNEAQCQPYGKSPGIYAKISVTDTGVGIDKAIQQRIFDPFFTTKAQGRGTGLGLASAYGIVENHQGFITLESSLGEGSTFNIFLPITEQHPQKSLSEEKELKLGTETILLIDDEEMILTVGRGMLEKLGYQVFTANSGEEGIKCLQQNRSVIQLVILDLIMPGMEGDEVFDKIFSINPSLPVILSSGYAINGKAEKTMQKGCSAFIQKPFRLAEISQLLRNVLTGTEKDTKP